MGRNRTRADPDRYLGLRQGNYHYKRRVPVAIEHLDERAPHVRASLKTDDRGLARRKRDLLKAADDALWASLITKGVTDPARRRYEAAVKRVEALDFTFHCRWRLLAARSGSECRIGRRLYRRRSTRGHRGGRHDGGGPPRCRPAGGDLGRSAERRLLRSGSCSRTRPYPCQKPCRKAVGRSAAALRHRHRHRRPSGITGLVGIGAQPSHAQSRRRALRSVGGPSTISTATSESMPIRSSQPAMASRPGGRCATCARWIKRLAQTSDQPTKMSKSPAKRRRSAG
jgi:hypothetical protein